MIYEPTLDVEQRQRQYQRQQTQQQQQQQQLDKQHYHSYDKQRDMQSVFAVVLIPDGGTGINGMLYEASYYEASAIALIELKSWKVSAIASTQQYLDPKEYTRDKTELSIVPLQAPRTLRIFGEKPYNAANVIPRKTSKKYGIEYPQILRDVGRQTWSRLGDHWKRREDELSVIERGGQSFPPRPRAMIPIVSQQQYSLRSSTTLLPQQDISPSLERNYGITVVVDDGKRGNSSSRGDSDTCVDITRHKFSGDDENGATDSDEDADDLCHCMESFEQCCDAEKYCDLDYSSSRCCRSSGRPDTLPESKSSIYDEKEQEAQQRKRLPWFRTDRSVSPTHPITGCCISNVWKCDAIAVPKREWWIGREVTFVSDAHLCCGFGPKQAQHVEMLDTLLADAFENIGERIVFVGDMYDLWCAAGGRPPKSGMRKMVERGLEKAVSTVTPSWWTSPSWAPCAWGTDSSQRVGESDFVLSLVDRGSAFCNAMTSCAMFEPWDALFPSIMTTWPRTHAAITRSVFDGHAIFLAGNHDAALALHFRDFNGKHVPCYNSVEFSDVVRVEHGHRRDFACDDRSALSYTSSCLACAAGHWATLSLSSVINTVLRCAYSLATKCSCSEKIVDSDGNTLAVADGTDRGSANIVAALGSQSSDAVITALQMKRDIDKASHQQQQRQQLAIDSDDTTTDGVVVDSLAKTADVRNVHTDTTLPITTEQTLQWLPKSLRVVVFGHTHEACIKTLPKTGSVYVNCGNSARPTKLITGSVVHKVTRGFIEVFNAVKQRFYNTSGGVNSVGSSSSGDKSGKPSIRQQQIELSREERDALTIDAAKIKFGDDGTVLSAEIGIYDLVGKFYYTKNIVRFSTCAINTTASGPQAVIIDKDSAKTLGDGDAAPAPTLPDAIVDCDAHESLRPVEKYEIKPKQ